MGYKRNKEPNRTRNQGETPWMPAYNREKALVMFLGSKVRELYCKQCGENRDHTINNKTGGGHFRGV